MSLLPYDTEWRRERFDVPGYKLVDGYLIRKQRSIKNVTMLLSVMSLAYRFYRRDSFGCQINVSVAFKDLNLRIVYSALFPQDGTEYVEHDHRERYRPFVMRDMFYHAYSSLCLNSLAEEDVINELLAHEYIACVSYFYLRAADSDLILTLPLECTGTMFGIFPNELGKKYTSVDDLQRVFGAYYALPVVFDKAVLSISNEGKIVFVGRFYFEGTGHFVVLADDTIRRDESDKGYNVNSKNNLNQYLHIYQQRLGEMGVILSDDIITEFLNPVDFSHLFLV